MVSGLGITLPGCISGMLFVSSHNMSYTKKWNTRGRRSAGTLLYKSWMKWFRRSYYTMRLWYRLTGYVPRRAYKPLDRVS